MTDARMPGEGPQRPVGGGRLRAGSRHTDVTATEWVGGPERGDIVICDPDPVWTERFAEHRRRVRAALGPVAHSVEHVGSTSVPGLAAKPIVDMLVTVDDVTAEEDYLWPLLDAGYRLRVREPRHRMMRTPKRDVHVHIYEASDVSFRSRMHERPNSPAQQLSSGGTDESRRCLWTER